MCRRELNSKSVKEQESRHRKLTPVPTDTLYWFKDELSNYHFSKYRKYQNFMKIICLLFFSIFILI